MQLLHTRAAVEARGEAVSGNKAAWLRRRLHTAVVRAYLAAAEADATGFSVDSEHAYTFNTLAWLLTF